MRRWSRVRSPSESPLSAAPRRGLASAALLALASAGASGCVQRGAPTGDALRGHAAAELPDAEPLRFDPLPGAGGELDRTVLPIAAPERPTFTALDIRDVAERPQRFEVTAPDGAPNVVVVLIDDFGFGVSSTFGGPVATPTMDQLAAEGLRYNNFHTTALCSPTRVALKTGRNHHMANAGSIMESSTAFPGNTGQVPRQIAPLAEVLRLNGYSTAAVGKWHETAPWEVSVSGPFDRWPLQQGFDFFYGFIGAETNQWSPTVVEGNTRVPLPDRPDYHFLTDMTDRAIQWVRAQQSMTPDKPFFIYYAPGATHAPHHVPKEWIDRYAGEFDAGWDALREATLARQKELGVVPEATALPEKPAAIKDWEGLSDLEKRVFRRQAEVYAGFAAMTDHEIGRLIAAIDALGERDNTLVIFVAGDNGASAEGGAVGTFNESTYFNSVDERLEDVAARLGEWGGPTTYPHMASGWAVALDSPHKWTKQVASDFGGTRNAMIVRWPQRVRRTGELRRQFHHVIDVAPTVLEAAGLPEPKVVAGVDQIPIQGTSMVYTFDDPDAADRHTTQYFEMFGNRSIYHEGWLARTIHKAPWEAAPRGRLVDDEWELFHATEDFSLAHDLSAAEPEKLAALRRLFLQEAVRNHVLPIDDRSVERLDPLQAGRPDVLAGRTSLTLYPGMVGMAENAFINLKNASFTIDARVDVDAARPEGVLLAQGGRFGGWALHLDGGAPAFTYNFVGLEATTIKAERPLPRGAVAVRVEFAYDGGKGSGGTATLFVGDEEVASGRIPRTQANVFSVDETADVGVDLATAVVPGLAGGERSRLRGGAIETITVSVAR